MLERVGVRTLFFKMVVDGFLALRRHWKMTMVYRMKHSPAHLPGGVENRDYKPGQEGQPNDRQICDVEMFRVLVRLLYR